MHGTCSCCEPLSHLKCRPTGKLVCNKHSRVALSQQGLALVMIRLASLVAQHAVFVVFVVCTHTKAEQYRGEADASQELLAFILRSSAVRQQHEQKLAAAAAAAGPSIPYLPSGSIVSGLPAALLTQAELAGLPAELLVVVEQVPSLVPETLMQLAKLVVGCLQSALGVAGQPGIPSDLKWAGSLVEGSVVDAARLKLQRTAYRPSSVYS